MVYQRLFFLGLAAATTVAAVGSSQCRVIPGDEDWPQPKHWASLNKTLNGRLIESVPAASVCHDAPFDNYDAEKCAELQSTWHQNKLSHMDGPADFLSPIFKNHSCDLFTPRSQPCELGNHASYVIVVEGPEHVKAGISFAKKHNIRLVIKNTGHDYLGRSTGKGGLTLWTHKLKSTKYIPNYEASYYSGPAFKLGAGIQGYEALQAADETGTRMVGGTCPTVGIVGGYTQGGGHSILSTSHGLAADNVLEWEVVTMDGRHLVATPEKNSDLYWALSGGGPGNFAVVLSMTSRAFPDGIIGGAQIFFDDSKVGNDKFWEAVGAFHEILPPFVDSGNSFLFLLTNNFFLTASTTMPGANLNKVNTLLKPFLDDLEKRGIDYQYEPRVSKNFLEHYSHSLGPLPEGIIDFAPFVDSRIIPRGLLLNPRTNRIVIDALRNATLAEGYNPMPCMTLNVYNQPHPDNAVHPAWRDALTFCAPDGNWDKDATPAEMVQRTEFSTNVLQPMLNKATPGGAVYLSEVSYKQQNWQEEMYGANYQNLLHIKQKYDPESLLYVNTGVGSDVWHEDHSRRLCRTEIPIVESMHEDEL